MLVLTSAAAADPFLPPDTVDPGWNHLRGNAYDGHSPEVNLLNRWPKQGPPVLWVKELGQGYSGVVVASGRAYTQYQTLGGQFVACLDVDTGKEVWRYRYDWPFELTGMYPGPRATPTLANDRLYFAGPSGLVGCLTLQGKLVWSTNPKEQFNGAGTGFGYACTPTVEAGKVFLPIGGQGASMIALNATDGSLVWKSGDDSASYTPAMPITLNGRRQIVGYLEHALIGYDMATGQELWRKHLSAGYDEHSAWPIYQEPRLWISAPFHAGSQMLELSASGETDSPEVVWQSLKMSNDVASSVLVDRFIYGFDLRDVQSKLHRPSRGAFRCFDWRTGKQLWENSPAEPRGDTTTSGSPVVGHATVIVADGKLIMLNDTGELIVAMANPDRYEEIGRVSVLGGEIGWTAPALHRGRLFARNHSRMVCVYLGRPELLEPQHAETAIHADSMPQSTYRDISHVLGVEPEYAMDPPSWRWLGNWFLYSLACLAAPMILVAGVWRLSFRSTNWLWVRWIAWLLAFTCGAIAGPLLSIRLNDFVFTWPVCLFVSFTAACSQLQPFRATDDDVKIRPQAAWHSRNWIIVCILCCVIYLLLCRRLSLVTELAFLAGFGGATPVLASYYLFATKRLRNAIGESLIILVSYTAFYATTVAVLAMRYDLPGS